MAPSVVEIPVVDIQVNPSKLEATTPAPKTAPRWTPGFAGPAKTFENGYEHADFVPSFPDVKWAPLEEVPYEDKGLLGDPEYKNLFADATDVFDYHPKIGTEVQGVNLKTLTDAQKNDLARLIAYRGVVYFRDQGDFTLEEQLDLGRYYGPLHKHATTAVPAKAGFEEVHVVWAETDSASSRALFSPQKLWHSDVSYEIQPPSYTSLKILEGPPRGGGGDTLFSNQYAVYDLLSPGYQKYLEGLTAYHSAEEQAKGSRDAGRPVRREPVITEHPLVRVNPVTGFKSIYYNPGFVVAIKGVPKLESDSIKAYLDQIITGSPEIHARVQWAPGTIVFWDNRSVNHSASYGFFPHRRHAVRSTPHGERPYFDPNGKSQEETIRGSAVNKDGARPSNYND